MNRSMAISLAACFILGGAAATHPKAQDKVSMNIALGRKAFVEIYGEGKIELVDQLYSEDFVDDSPGGGAGRELIKQAVAGFHQACPDLRMEIEDVFATEEKVVVRYKGHGTQTGAFGEIPPTGKTISVRGITVFLIRNGKIKTEWTEYDRLGMLRQIGAVPAPRD